MTRTTPARLALGLWVALTLYLFLTPAPPQGGPEGSDKLVHAALFAVLAVLGRWSGGGPLPVLLALAAYAGLTEVLQATLPIGRDGDPVDLVADTVGVLAGLAAVALLSRARRAAPSPSRRPGSAPASPPRRR